MTLKPGRKSIGGTDISFFMNETATAGRVVTFNQAGNYGTGVGEALDDSDAVAVVPTGATGTAVGEPIGILMNDVVNYDLTRQHLNQHKDEVQVNSKVTILTDGWVTTNVLKSGESPRGGLAAHFDVSGEITTGTSSTRIGRFLSGKDADGYAKVEVKLGK